MTDILTGARPAQSLLTAIQSNEKSTEVPGGVNSPYQAQEIQTVYLVKDDQDLRENLSLLIAGHGFKVVCCESAEAFYRSFAVQPASIVVMDIGLPGENGLEVCDHLRSHNATMGIILISARGLPNDRIDGLRAGADIYLIKPFEIEELILCIARLIKRIKATLVHPENYQSGVRDHLSLVNYVSVEPVDGKESLPLAGCDQRWIFDAGLGILTAPNGIHRRARGHERSVLEMLTRSPAEPISIERLCACLHIPQNPQGKRRVEVIISRLRKNVEQTTGLSLPIFLTRGLGYHLKNIDRKGSAL